MTPKSDRTDLATRALSEPGANPASAHLTRQPGQVSRQERERALGQPGLTVWFTGLSASGKSTLASALERTLVNRGRAVYYLDGDNVRLGLNRDLGFSHEARSENIRRIAEVSRLFNDAGLIVLAAFALPRRPRSGQRDRRSCFIPGGLSQRPPRGVRSSGSQRFVSSGTAGGNSRVHGHFRAVRSSPGAGVDPPGRDVRRAGGRGLVGAAAQSRRELNCGNPPEAVVPVPIKTSRRSLANGPRVYQGRSCPASRAAGRWW